MPAHPTCSCHTIKEAQPKLSDVQRRPQQHHNPKPGLDAVKEPDNSNISNLEKLWNAAKAGNCFRLLSMLCFL